MLFSPHFGIGVEKSVVASCRSWSGTRLGQNVKMLSNPFLHPPPGPPSDPSLLSPLSKKVSLVLFRKSSIPNHLPPLLQTLFNFEWAKPGHGWNTHPRQCELPSCSQIFRLMRHKVYHRRTAAKQIIVFPLRSRLFLFTVSALLRLHGVLSSFLPVVLEYRISLRSQPGSQLGASEGGGRERGSLESCNNRNSCCALAAVYPPIFSRRPEWVGGLHSASAENKTEQFKERKELELLRNGAGWARRASEKGIRLIGYRERS